MKQKILFWLIDHISRWWVLLPAIFLSVALTTSGIVGLPAIGTLISMGVGFFYALHMVDTKTEKENDNG